LITLGPVFVTPAPAKTAKLFAVPRPTDVAARELAARAKAAISATASEIVPIFNVTRSTSATISMRTAQHNPPDV
jgi:hypothetical protein